jgi:TusA-related sulfurtransferase
MIFIDLTAYRCPLALVKLKLALRQSGAGEELHVSIVDSGSRQDVPRLLKKLRYPYTELRNDDQMLVLSVVKSTAS